MASNAKYGKLIELDDEHDTNNNNNINNNNSNSNSNGVNDDDNNNDSDLDDFVDLDDIDNDINNNNHQNDDHDHNNNNTLNGSNGLKEPLLSKYETHSFDELSKWNASHSMELTSNTSRKARYTALFFKLVGLGFALYYNCN